MPDLTYELRRNVSLRERATLRVSPADSRDTSVMSAAGALGALHRLASSPATATEALSLLHELQVYQVEIDLQDEELRSSRAELETLVNRLQQLYDGSPAGSFTIDQDAVIMELNLAGARLLGWARSAAIGRCFHSLLPDDEKRLLQTLLERAATGLDGPQCEVRVIRGDGGIIRTRLSASVDPAGPSFILASMTAGDARGI